MFRPIFLLVLSSTVLSSCAAVGLQRGFGLTRAIENSINRNASETEQAEFVTVNGVPMTVSLDDGRTTAFVRAEPNTASILMMVEAAESATGCEAELIGDGPQMTGVAEDQPLSADALRSLGGAAQIALTC